jgi:tRNA A-37 threonylcarbamoyl transferase component Bud32
MEVLRQDQPPRRGADAGKVLALGRIDAPKGGRGKPCGESNIPKTHKCSKSGASASGAGLRTAAKIALAAGALAGGAVIARKLMTKEEWENSPHNTRKNPKLSPEEAQRIADEAIAGGQIWDVQEKINARRRADLNAECGGGLGKILAPAKFDALVPKPRCQAGAGAFGTYFVHPSEKYGIKVFRNWDEDDVQWEFDRLDKAHYAGVNVPQPLAMNATRDSDGEVKSQTLILSHLKDYKTIESEYRSSSGNADNAPLIVQRKIVREFRTLHTAGLAHGDIHNGNIMVHPRSKKVALIDFGYATELDDRYQPHNSRTGVDNLLYDMRRLPEFLGFSNRGAEFLNRYKGVLENVEKQANDSLRAYDREGKFELAVKRYHDALETELLWDDRMPRSRFVSGVDQPRIPGLTRRILTANANTFQRQVMEQIGQQQPTFHQEGAKNLGVKPARLFLALKPERDARLARQRKQPFGTPIA